MRPAGRDGQGQDRGRRFAAPADRAATSTREVLELRFGRGVAGDADGQLDGLAERIERLPDRVLVYAATARRRSPRSTRAGSSRRQVLVRRSSLEDVFLRLTGRSLIE